MSLIIIQCILGYENFEMQLHTDFKGNDPFRGMEFFFFFSRINKLSIISFSQGTEKK